MASPPVTYVNSAAKRTIGWPAAEILGRTLEQLYPSDVAAAYAENDQWALKVRQPVEAVEEARTDHARFSVSRSSVDHDFAVARKRDFHVRDPVAVNSGLERHAVIQTDCIHPVRRQVDLCLHFAQLQDRASWLAVGSTTWLCAKDPAVTRSSTTAGDHPVRFLLSRLASWLFRGVPAISS